MAVVLQLNDLNVTCVKSYSAVARHSAWLERSGSAYLTLNVGVRRPDGSLSWLCLCEYLLQQNIVALCLPPVVVHLATRCEFVKPTPRKTDQTCVFQRPCAVGLR